MGEFRFKRFSVRNEDSAMKVNTDGVLLGAAATLGGPDVLDIGTGTGTIALILAQRMEESGHGDFRITGIDIDAPSAREASANFNSSPWAGKITAECVPLQDFHPEGGFDLIVSNPPYYDNSLLNPDFRDSRARHSMSLSYREVLAFAAEKLKEDGTVSLVLPSDCEKALLREARSRGLHPSAILRIRTTPRKAPSRIVAEFSRLRVDTKEKALTIQDGGAFTEDYIALTGAFYEKL